MLIVIILYGVNIKMLLLYYNVNCKLTLQFTLIHLDTISLENKSMLGGILLQNSCSNTICVNIKNFTYTQYTACDLYYTYVAHRE